MWDAILAASPIFVVLVGMIGLKKPAVIVTPIAMAYTILLGLFYFEGSAAGMAASLKVGILDGVRIVWLIFGAFTILMMMMETGTMDKIKEVISGLANDRRIHVLIIAVMFGPMHVQAAVSLGQNPITVFAAQNVGGAIGNMICFNNVVAEATTVGILGQEGVLMRRVFLAFFVFLLTYGCIALLYTHVLFKG